MSWLLLSGFNPSIFLTKISFAFKKCGCDINPDKPECYIKLNSIQNIYKKTNHMLTSIAFAYIQYTSTICKKICRQIKVINIHAFEFIIFQINQIERSSIFFFAKLNYIFPYKINQLISTGTCQD